MRLGFYFHFVNKSFTNQGKSLTPQSVIETTNTVFQKSRELYIICMMHILNRKIIIYLCKYKYIITMAFAQ